MNILFRKQKLFLGIFLVFSVFISLVFQGKIEEFHIFGFLILFGFFYFSYVFYVYNYRSPYYIRKLLVLTFILKIISVFVLVNVLEQYVGIPFLSYKDDYVYQETSTKILETWKAKGIGFYPNIYFSTGFYSGYPNVSALAMYFFGDSYLIPRIMNCFFSTASVWYFYKTIKSETNEKIVKQITTLFAFSLTFVFYSSLQLKDTILVFLLSALIFNLSNFLKEGAKLKDVLSVILFSIFLVFFRAATLLPLLISLLLTFFLTREKKNSRFKNSLFFIFIFIGFIYSWNFLSEMNLLSLDAAGYFESRFDQRGTNEALSGGNSLSALGPLQLILGPLYMFFSLFLPTPLMVDLGDYTNSINSHFLPAMQIYAILPISLIGMVFVIRNRKTVRVGVFILLFIILYKLGQASSKSIFDTRQSLPAFYGLYLLLVFAIPLDDPNFIKRNRKYMIMGVVIMLIISFSFAFVRLLIRNEI